MHVLTFQSAKYDLKETITISVLDSIVADPHIQIRVSQYGRWIKNVFLINGFQHMRIKVCEENDRDMLV